MIKAKIPYLLITGLVNHNGGCTLISSIPVDRMKKTNKNPWTEGAGLSYKWQTAPGTVTYI